MPLSTPAPRQKKHIRAIRIEGFQRDDGLWDIEGMLTDVKTFDFTTEIRSRAAGAFHHEMVVRLTIDTEFTIRDVEVASDSNPHGGECASVVPDYRGLIGLNLKRGFRKAVLERMGGIRGCTHINELLGVMPTGAFQSMSGTIDSLGSPDRIKMVFDRCRAWDRGGAVVLKHFPAWYVPKKDGAKTAPE